MVKGVRDVVTGACVLFVTLGGVPGPVARAAADGYDTACAAPTRTLTGGGTAPPIRAGEVVLFASGAYTSAAAVLTGGGVACLAPGATWTVSTFDNPVGSIYVRGRLAVDTFLALIPGFLLDNEGAVSFGAVLQTSSDAMLINHKGATWEGIGSQSLLGTSSLTNDGTMNLTGSLTLAEQSTFTNTGEATLGAFQNGATTTNTGHVTVEGGATTSGTFVNRCWADFLFGYSSEGSTDNEGVIVATGGTVSRMGLYISGRYAGTATSVTSGSDFLVTSAGLTTGAGGYRFTGTTTVRGSVIGNPLITFYDTTRTGNQIFDVVTGTVTNVVRAVVPAPDPAVPPAGCAAATAELSITKGITPGG
ncbi:hypothetical protein Ssi03_01540 [Sphaerisporangium siamense]|uniref:Uncharacterized protein n=1 Tax=Sphaerisporangium siamense TaxID=795645 RepID=A0A7W7DBC9_9ACTN|nr:hypothetical protein [Sphaerisporangium siamense]MBB4703692.1 hypothetical protein [Sphaerisporangium siamense]GII82164.1 hypothetical protein Ssi03_01540 [Sphaerisporangium siamense]